MAKRPRLPCYPCPHDSSCCAYGTSLTKREARALRKRYGDTHVYETRWGEWRTRIKGGRCVFLKENSCVLHADPQYPATCRGFPWTLADQVTPYPFPKDICGEIRLIEARSLHRTSR
jgi:hypothetical protein